MVKSQMKQFSRLSMYERNYLQKYATQYSTWTPWSAVFPLEQNQSIFWAELIASLSMDFSFWGIEFDALPILVDTFHKKFEIYWVWWDDWLIKQIQEFYRKFIANKPNFYWRLTWLPQFVLETEEFERIKDFADVLLLNLVNYQIICTDEDRLYAEMVKL